MQRQNVRVIVASEYPEVRYFLREVVEEKGGAVTVGEAQNASQALILARNLTPDVAIIDCYLPYSGGLDAIPLSRIGGLEIAQTISEEIPNIRVILLNNLDTVTLADRGLSSDVGASYSIVSKGANISSALKDLCHEVVQPNALVFANVEAKQWAALQRKVTNTSYKTVLFIGLGTVGALCLTFIIVFGGGVVLAFAVAVIMLLSLVRKRIASFWRKIKSGTKRLATK